MQKFDYDKAVIAIELTQFVSEFAHEVDINGGRNIRKFYTGGGVFLLGSQTYRGHAGISKFYEDRALSVRTGEKDGVRTGRHVFTNLRFEIPDKHNATIYCTNSHYSAGGKAPVPLVGPTAIADCRLICQRTSEGVWRMTEFRGLPIFIGKDDFLNKLILKST